ncbi:unnamed protein product, partial [Brassica oleracea]
LSPTIPPRLTGTGEKGPGGQTETMLNPKWPGLELVMAGTSAEVYLPPDHDVRLTQITFNGMLLGVIYYRYFFLHLLR